MDKIDAPIRRLAHKTGIKAARIKAHYDAIKAGDLTPSILSEDEADTLRQAGNDLFGGDK